MCIVKAQSRKEVFVFILFIGSEFGRIGRGGSIYKVSWVSVSLCFYRVFSELCEGSRALFLDSWWDFVQAVWTLARPSLPNHTTNDLTRRSPLAPLF